MRHRRNLTISVLLILAICCGCGAPSPQMSTAPTPPPYTQPTPPTFTEPIIDPVVQAYLDAPQDYVVFSQGTEESTLYLPLEELLSYETQYPDCNGTLYRDQLEGERLSIYQAYLYAMEHQYTEFSMYTQGKEEGYHDLRQLLSLDSPLLEQNYDLSEEHIFTWPAKYIGTETEFRMEAFADQYWQRKLEALEECRKIVAGIPPELTTQLEKMEYLYHYVCDHVEYLSIEDTSDPNFLYDAVCTGKTNCDGYANMLALLFRLIGVECCEVMGYPRDPDLEEPLVIPETLPEEEAGEEEDEGLVGHTWVCAKVDGVYYNFDATYDDTTQDYPVEGDIYFGFSDRLIDMDFISYRELVPQCTDTSMEHPYADLMVPDITTRENIKKIARLSEKRANDEDYEILVVMERPLEDNDLEPLVDNFFDYTTDLSSVDVSAMGYDEYTLVWVTVETW